MASFTDIIPLEYDSPEHNQLVKLHLRALMTDTRYLINAKFIYNAWCNWVNYKPTQEDFRSLNAQPPAPKTP